MTTPPTPTPIGTSLGFPDLSWRKRRPLAPFTPEENPPVLVMDNGLTTEQYAELVISILRATGRL